MATCPLHRVFRAGAICLIALASACSNGPRALAPEESALNVNGPTEHQFHTSLYFPKGTALHYPGYLIALEKAPQHIIAGPATSNGQPDSFLRDEVQYFRGERGVDLNLGSMGLLEKLKDDAKAMFISHIVRFRSQSVPAQSRNPYTYTDHCFLYNAFMAPSVARSPEGASNLFTWRKCDLANQTTSTSTSLYSAGATALDQLRDDMAGDLQGGGFTHVLVIVMGWNTAQDEAVRNFNDIVGNLFAAAYESTPGADKAATAEQVSDAAAHFRPLVLGVTWPSFWSNRFTNAFSYMNKASDADEIGVSWLNLLLNRTIPDALTQARVGAKLVVIGHSFGARAATRALFSSPALANADDKKPTSRVDLLFGLQGAASINRFGGEESMEGTPYRDFAALPTQIVLTASEHDKAAGGPVFWYDPFGSIDSFEEACDSNEWHRHVFECVHATQTDQTFALFAHPKRTPWTYAADGERRVIYVDASDGVVEFNSPGSGGGAHSDIYRMPLGRLMWTFIERFAL